LKRATPVNEGERRYRFLIILYRMPRQLDPRRAQAHGPILVSAREATLQNAASRLRKCYHFGHLSWEKAAKLGDRE
jgi:hypothetical protein